MWWHQQQVTQGFNWEDPYHGCGGLGASSAQFLACYWAICSLQQTPPSLQGLLDAYYNTAWKGQGLRPSGYDLMHNHNKDVFILISKKA